MVPHCVFLLNAEDMGLTTGNNYNLKKKKILFLVDRIYLVDVFFSSAYLYIRLIRSLTFQMYVVKYLVVPFLFVLIRGRNKKAEIKLLCTPLRK